MYLLYLAITTSGVFTGISLGIGNGSWSFIALPGCTGVNGPGTDGAGCVDGIVYVVVDCNGVVVDCNGTGMDKPGVAGGNGAGSKGVTVGGPGVANGTKDVGGPLGAKFAVCPCKPRIF